MKKWLVLTIIVISGIAFTGLLRRGEYDPVPIPPSLQRLGGDPVKGYEYLTTGDYVRGGIPYSFFLMGMGKDKDHYLPRDGKNEKLPYSYTAFTSPNGEVL